MGEEIVQDEGDEREGEGTQRPSYASIIRLALSLLKSDEKTAADREAKLSILKFLRSLEDGRSDEYIRGYREGYTQGYRDGVVGGQRGGE